MFGTFHRRALRKRTGKPVAPGMRVDDGRKDREVPDF